MGLRRGNGPGGTKTGIQIDCMVCHGGSIGGTSYVGLGNTHARPQVLLRRADAGRRPAAPAVATFTLTPSRGTVNAGQIAVVLLSFRNPDLSLRTFPLPLGAKLPRAGRAGLVAPDKKKTMYYDGRTDARSVRTNMQFMLGEKTLEQFKELGADLPRHPGLPQEPQAAEVSVRDRPGPGRSGQGPSSRRPAPSATAPTAPTASTRT